MPMAEAFFFNLAAPILEGNYSERIILGLPLKRTTLHESIVSPLLPSLLRESYTNRTSSWDVGLLGGQYFGAGGGGAEFGSTGVRRGALLLLAKLLLQAIERVCDALLLDQVDDSADGSNEEEHANHCARNCPSIG